MNNFEYILLAFFIFLFIVISLRSLKKKEQKKKDEWLVFEKEEGVEGQTKKCYWAQKENGLRTKCYPSKEELSKEIIK